MTTKRGPKKSGQAPTAASPEPDVVLDEVWAKMLPLFTRKREAFFRAIADHQLTPPHSLALTMLTSGPLRMRDIADGMVCDASYVTAIVDRLEQLGLAARQPSATDRRVKEIALTPRGITAADQIQAEMKAPPPALRQLSAADRATLASILGKLEPSDNDSLSPKPAFRVYEPGRGGSTPDNRQQPTE